MCSGLKRVLGDRTFSREISQVLYARSTVLFVSTSRDRREQHRLRVAFTVIVEGPFGLRRCVARDISARGLFIETWDEFPVGTEIRVTFSLPDGSWEMTARCTVRHVLDVHTKEGVMRGIGVSFEEIEEDLADNISVARRVHA